MAAHPLVGGPAGDDTEVTSATVRDQRFPLPWTCEPPAPEDVDLSIGRGGWAAIIGPNGAVYVLPRRLEA
jgi:hypothetical protein